MTTPYPTEGHPARDSEDARNDTHQDAHQDEAQHDDVVRDGAGLEEARLDDSALDDSGRGVSDDTSRDAVDPSSAVSESAERTERTEAVLTDAMTERIPVVATQPAGPEAAETTELDSLAVSGRLDADRTDRTDRTDVSAGDSGGTVPAGGFGGPGDVGGPGGPGGATDPATTVGTTSTTSTTKIESGYPTAPGPDATARLQTPGVPDQTDRDDLAARTAEQAPAAPTVSYVSGASQTPARPIIASPPEDAPRRRGARMGTVVWGILLAAIGAGIVARGLGVQFDVELALIIVLCVMGGALLVGSVVAGIRRT